MKTIFTSARGGVITAAAFVLLSGLAAAHTDENEQAVEPAQLTAAQQAVVTTLEAYAAAYAATDLERLRSLTVGNESFSYFEGSGADWGWDAYAAHLNKEMPAFSQAQYEFTDVRPVVGEQFAYATFSWKLDVVILSEEFEGGRHPVSMQGLGTAVLARQGANWQLQHIATARKTSR
jgi:hypothetical protein